MRCLVPFAIALAASAQADEPAKPAPEVVQRANVLLDAELGNERGALYLDALGALGASHRGDARERLEGIVAGKDGHLRFAAAQGLKMLADPASAPALVAAWRKEKGWAIKKELSAAAGAVGARELVPDIKAALLYETQLDVREALAWALYDLGEPDAKAALAQVGDPPRKGLVKDGADSWSRHVLQGKKPGDERLAVKTLALMGQREDVPLLQKQLDAKDPETRLWAAAALVRLGR